MNSAKTTRQILEDALLAAPEDVATHSAYADLLMEEGDPWGELIQLQLRLESTDLSAMERKALKRSERELIESHQSEWLGSAGEYLLNPDLHCSFAFRRGWLDSLTIPILTVNFARVLRECPQIRFLRTFINIDSEAETFGVDFPPGNDVPENDTFPGLHAMIGCRYLTNVRKLQLGDRLAFHSDERVGHGTGDALVALLDSMPRIQEIVTHAYTLNARQLFDYRFADIRVLEVSRGFSYELDVLTDNPTLQSLTRLVLQPAGNGEFSHGMLTLDGIQRMVRSKAFPRLRELAIRADQQGDDLCVVLAESKILQKLRWLDLSGNLITDFGAVTLAKSPHIRQLKHLIIQRNCLTNEGIAALRAVIPNVDVGTQRGSIDDEDED